MVKICNLSTFPLQCTDLSSLSHHVSMITYKKWMEKEFPFDFDGVVWVSKENVHFVIAFRKPKKMCKRTLHFPIYSIEKFNFGTVKKKTKKKRVHTALHQSCCLQNGLRIFIVISLPISPNIETQYLLNIYIKIRMHN